MAVYQLKTTEKVIEATKSDAHVADIKAFSQQRRNQIDDQISDDAAALEFTARHRRGWRYVGSWDQWFNWNGRFWEAEETYQVYDLARAVARELADAAHDHKMRARIATAQKVVAIVRLASYDRAHAATIDMWDCDPWLLNTQTGVVDLRTGQVRNHDPKLYMTKITATGASGECPTWLHFLSDVTNGDEDLQAFLQRIAGYTLTGLTRDHAMFFFYGTGGNGKGVFLNTLGAILRDYAKAAPLETFTAASFNERHPTDLAMLRGARMVTAQETEKGQNWAEAKIKSLTGGDRVSARFMRQDFFEYVPEFKLLISGNHKPGLTGVDEAIRRRLHLVPLTVTIPADRRDPNLTEKLKAEWPGILHWMIQGCLEWQRQGLNPPGAVKEATNSYFAEEDAIGQWIDECCTMDSNGFGLSTALYESWKRWATQAGKRVGSQKDFSQELGKRRGIQGGARQGGTGLKGFIGITLRS